MNGDDRELDSREGESSAVQAAGPVAERTTAADAPYVGISPQAQVLGPGGDRRRALGAAARLQTAEPLLEPDILPRSMGYVLRRDGGNLKRYCSRSTVIAIPDADKVWHDLMFMLRAEAIRRYLTPIVLNQPACPSAIDKDTLALL